MRKPRLGIVSSHKICCALAYYAEALKSFLDPSFDVEIVDLNTTLLREAGDNCYRASEAHIDELCKKLKQFDVVNLHLELGLFGTNEEYIASRILKICQAAGRLILTVHTIDCKGTTGHHYIYQQIMQSLKKRPPTNPYHLIAHLPQERQLIEKVFQIDKIVDFPLIYLTNERRAFFQNKSNPNGWKKQFGFCETDITIGLFGMLSAHKNYLHALKTLRILPDNYKLLIVGEAHHMSIKEWKVDPVIEELVSYLDQHPKVAERVVFTGKREDSQYYEDLANIDFILLPTYEVSQSGSATFSNAVELGRPILKSNTWNSTGYETYFPNCFEKFDVGNIYETKHKIMYFQKNKIENLAKRRDLFSEKQIRQIYMDIYESMKAAFPVEMSLDIKFERPKPKRSGFLRPALRKIKNVVFN